MENKYTSLNIGFDAKRAFQNTRGLGNYSRNLISGLLEYCPGNNYFLYGAKPSEYDLIKWMQDLPETTKIRAPHKSSRLLQAYWRSHGIIKSINTDQIDIYHGLSHEIPLNAKNIKAKKVVTIHDLLFLRFKQNFSFADRNIYLSKIKYSCRNSDRVISVSNQTKSDLINYLGIGEEKIDVVYQSCNQNFYRTVSFDDRQKIKNKYRLPDRYLLFVGALVKHKNIERILEALAMISASELIPLVIVGKPNSYKEVLLKLITKLKLEKHVIFINYISNADMPAVYQMAQILVWPSLFEGFGIPVIEALFSNVPVITSNIGCLTEVGGEGSYYVDPNKPEEISNAISKIISSDSLAAHMQKVGRKHVEKFHVKNTTGRLMEIYSSL
ncbi:MAG: glycosyltransferase family 4 protein [Prolixibacteraceae bacterium]|nr:glycosyltransferase family 4 protein [Prolixibacteraceae bacterium]